MSSFAVLRHGNVTARKEHRCDGCGQPIAKGVVHLAQGNVCDGRAYTWRECLACAEHWSAEHNRYTEERYAGWRLECGCPGV